MRIHLTESTYGFCGNNFHENSLDKTAAIGTQMGYLYGNPFGHRVRQKPTTISGDFFYTDYRTSGKMPQRSTYFRFLKSIRKIHRIRRILFPRYFLSGELLVDSHFRENGKGSTRSQNPLKNLVDSGIHRKGKKPLAFKNESYFLIC